MSQRPGISLLSAVKRGDVHGLAHQLLNSPLDILAIEVLAARLVVALGLGVVVAGVYLLTQRKPRAELAPFVTTLVLLTVLIAMVTLVIGNSVARAFGLVGALSIVRFRTVVEDTRDTAFVIFAVFAGVSWTS